MSIDFLGDFISAPGEGMLRYRRGERFWDTVEPPYNRKLLYVLHPTAYNKSRRQK